MKRKTRIIVAALYSELAVICAALAVAGGLPAKLLAQKRFDNLNYTAADYPYADLTVPADYITVTLNGMTLRVSPDMYRKSSDPQTVDSTIFISDSGRNQYVQIPCPTDLGEPELGNTGTPAADRPIQRFAKRVIGRQLRSWYDYYDILYSLNAESCSIHSLTGSKTFYEIAALKEETLPCFRQTWSFQCDSGKGFLNLLRTPETDPEHPQYSVLLTLHPFGSENTVQTAVITDDSLEACCAIANSVIL